MKAKLLLRIAAGMMLLHTVGHIFGTIEWENNPDPAVASVIKGMEDNQYDFMGRITTLASFYQGYCVVMIIVLLLLSVCLWLFSSTANAGLTRKLVMVFSVFLLAMAVLEHIYFFPLAAGMTGVAGVTSMAALFIKTKDDK